MRERKRTRSCMHEEWLRETNSICWNLKAQRRNRLKSKKIYIKGNKYRTYESFARIYAWIFAGEENLEELKEGYFEDKWTGLHEVDTRWWTERRNRGATKITKKIKDKKMTSFYKKINNEVMKLWINQDVENDMLWRNNRIHKCCLEERKTHR